MRAEPGEVWLADLGMMAKTRPVVIVSRHDSNPPRDLVIYAPCTSQNRGSDYEVDVSELPFLTGQSVVNVQGIGSIPVRRLEKKLGTVPGALLQKIRDTIKFSMDLD